MDHDLNRLATLDPARGREPTESERSRSWTRIEEAMASPRPVRWPRAQRLAIGLAAATVLAVGAAVGVPAILPDGDNAYASWTPVPESLSGPDSRAAADACARYLEGDAAAGDVVLAERRGVTTLLITWLRDGRLIICSSLETGQAAGASLLASGPGEEPPLPPAGRITFGGGMGATSDGGEWYSQATGRVGPGVTGVEVALPDGEVVRATTRQGWWAAWWPGREGSQFNVIRILVHTAEGTREYRQDQVS